MSSAWKITATGDRLVLGGVCKPGREMPPVRRRRWLCLASALPFLAQRWSSSNMTFTYPASLSKSSQHAKVDRRKALKGAAVVTPLIAALSSPLAEAAAETEVPDFSLANGMSMPAMALNTAGLSVAEAEKAIRLATAVGVRHVDFHPGAERDGVARVLASQDRSGLFLTTKIRKFNPSNEPTNGDVSHSVVAAASAQSQIDDDLVALGVKSVDMILLRDSPWCSVMQAQWAVLEDALTSGQTRAIGVVNYCEKALRCLKSTWKFTPAVNYIMFHVGMGSDAHGLRSFGESLDIKTFAYGPLGEPNPAQELMDSPVIQRIAAVHGRSAVQVALRWVVQSGVAVSVRPTLAFSSGLSICNGASCRQGLEERVQTFGWTLNRVEMAELDALTSPDGNPTLFSSEGCRCVTNRCE